ncbi:MAG: hypothetical protein WDZ51_17355 [Pirellulaceae bacterium]
MSLARPIFRFRSALLMILAVGVLAGQHTPAAMAQEVPAQDDAAKPADEKMAANYKKFEQTLSGVALVGSFTIVGKDVPAKPERYEIRSVRKLDTGDVWLFRARIKYGDKDVELPMPLEVKWAGNTPVISLDNVTLPGLGTFSSYVVIDGDKYAGTWTHGEVSGHMFGRIEKLKDDKGE